MSLTHSIDEARKAFAAGDTDKAAEVLSRLIAAFPDDGKIFWEIGRILGCHGRYEEASVAFKRAVQLDPSLSHVEFAVDGKTICLTDSQGSTAAAMLVEERQQDMYGLQRMHFAANDVVIDVGAHIGGVSIILAKLFPSLKIYAFEPAQRTFELLLKNIQDNHVTNITPIKQAVSGTSGTLELMWSPYDTAASGGCMDDETKKQLLTSGWVKEQVPCRTLEEIFVEHHLQRCAWLKLDCEGSEYDIFAKSTALEKVDRVSLELHIPETRYRERGDACVQDFLALLGRLAHPPLVDIASAVRMRGA